MQDVKADIQKDINAIKEFFGEIGPDLKEIYKLLQQLEHLSKQQPKNEEEKNTNLIEQLKTADKLMRSYEFLDEDISINGQRVKMIAHELLRKCKKANINPEFIKKISKEEWWIFNW